MGIFLRKWLGLTMAVALIALAMAATTIAGCGDEASTRTTFSYAEGSDPTSLDPALVDETVSGNIARYLFDGLVRYDSETSEVKPAVAESWESNSNATEFTFHLRKGVKFTNGNEVKAGDFVYGWTRALAPETKSSMASAILERVMGASDFAEGKTDKLAGVEAIDDYTLKVSLDKPMAGFISLLGHPAASPVPRDAVENQSVKFAEQPVGNGPYRLKEWKHDEQVVLEKNPDYYGDKAKVDEVTVKIIPNPATAVSELKAGNVDAVRILPPGQTEALRNDSSVRFFQGPGNLVRFLGFDITKPPFDNPKVREALAWDVDRDTIANKVLQGQATVADGFVPTSVPGHQDNAMPYSFDPEKASQLLAEAGYPGGNGLPPITLSYPGVGPTADAAQAIQSEFRKIGVQLEIAGLDKGAFLEQMLSGSLPSFIFSWQGDAPSADSFLFPLFESGNIGATDVFQYSNPAVDDLLGQARSAPDRGQSISLYNEAERKILKDAPMVPIAFGQVAMIYSPRVTKFIVTPLEDIALNEITVSSK